jgi:mannitol/fructose-specific phosphotransferase system IIA component (Ntr-type)
MQLMDLVVPEAVLPQLRSVERDEAVVELLDALVAAAAVPAGLREDLLAAMLQRERDSSTGFGKGVALPHAKHDELDRVIVAIGISSTGVDWGSYDRQPVFSVVMVISPKADPEQHLEAMDRLFTNLNHDRFRKWLRQAPDRRAVLDLLEEADASKHAD